MRRSPDLRLHHPKVCDGPQGAGSGSVGTPGQLTKTKYTSGNSCSDLDEEMTLRRSAGQQVRPLCATRSEPRVSPDRSRIGPQDGSTDPEIPVGQEPHGCRIAGSEGTRSKGRHARGYETLHVLFLACPSWSRSAHDLQSDLRVARRSFRSVVLRANRATDQDRGKVSLRHGRGGACIGSRSSCDPKT